MTSTVVPADDDLVERLLTNALYLRKHEDGICRLEANCLDEAASRIASLSSELARCRNALEEAREWFRGYIANGGKHADEEVATIDAALNPIGEEGAREP